MLKFVKKNPFLSLILISSAILRLYKIYDYAEFLGDQGRDLVIVRDFLKNGNLFFIGPQTSIGNMYLGPWFYYLIAPALLLANFNPLGPVIFTALLSVLTTYLISKIGQKWFSRQTGLIAALFYAISPVVIRFSTFSWNPNIMPIFTLLFVYFFVTALTEKRYPLLIWASLSFVMILNSHYLGLLLLPPATIFWLYYYQKTKSPILIKFSLIALGIFLLSLTPLVLFDLKHQGQNLNAFIKFFSQRQTTVNLKAYKALPILPSLFNQINTRLLFAKDETLGPILSIIFLILILFVYKKIKPKQKLYFWVLILWYLSGLIGLALYKQHIYDHYFGFLFPVLFLLLGLVINHLPLKIPIIVSLVTLNLTNNPLRFSPPGQLAYTEAIVDSIIDQSNQQPFALALLAKQNYDPPYRYFFYEKNARLVDLDHSMPDQLFVICEPHPDIDCNPINNSEWKVAAFGWAKIDKTWQINHIQIYQLSHLLD